MPVEVEGLDRLTRKLLKLPLASTRALKAQIALGAILVQGEAVKSISRGSRTGKKYKRGGKSAQRSAPGEFPKSDSGDLVKSIKREVSAGGLIQRVGTNLRYGRDLEFGNVATKLEPRPWLARTLKLNVKTISKNIARELKIVLARKA